MSDYFPMFFNIEGKQILIVGAGTIALRRIETLLSFGVALTVAAPDCKDAVLEYAQAGKLQYLDRGYHPDMLEKPYFMVIAATDDFELNRKICEDAREKTQALVNNAADKSQCDFYFPAIVREGDVIAGVCAGGKNHRLVRRAAAGMRSWLKQFMEQE